MLQIIESYISTAHIGRAGLICSYIGGGFVEVINAYLNKNIVL